MTTLVYDALETTIEQDFTINLNRRYTIEAINPYLMMFNEPSGTFTFSVLDSDTNILSSDTFTSADIKTDLSTSDSYAHIRKVIQFDNPLHLSRGTYTLKLSSSGYTFTESSHLGWVREFENIFNETTGTPSSDSENPFSFNIYENRSNIL